MAGQKKFGTFAGVFTPSILTILGVIMYMRMGWVVGNAGLIGTILIVVIAHVISVSTGLSLSSIATDKKVGAGGIYYILSRSMGIPIGGAIGITLYIGTAFSIALYLIGFAESFNGYFGFDTTINGLRIAGSIALFLLTTLALISTSVALKTQFFILAAIVISLGSIFFGTNEFVPQSVALFSTDNAVPIEVVFAIFFPAVTGFTAGVAMSGDLKDPKKSLPIGTIAAIVVGFVVYIGLTFFLSYYIDSETLRSDYNILMKIALYAPAVVVGIWGATLSSALGGVLGGPRILQAMSIDKVTPRFFGKGKGKNNEPVNALILVFIIAQAGILIGELDVIARIVSMFYLAAYGFINLSFFLEKWANPDFQPTFKVNRWFGLLGFVASFAIMFKLDMIAMFGAIIIIVGIYLLLQRKQIKLESGDVWQSVWENVVAKGLKRLDSNEIDTSTNWNPNIILFSGKSEHQPYLLELSNTVSGRTGIVTNFKLILDKDDTIPLTKTAQIVKDSLFDDLGIFARQVKVDNIYSGIENIASTFGFSGVEPNTIMMGWPKELRNSDDYSKMTQTLLHLDYNLLYLDFDKKNKFGKYQSVDLWWRETDNKNAEMMLSIVRFIIQSPEWNKAKIRVLFVNHNNIDNNIIKSKISKLVDELRVNVEIIVINNGVEQRPFYNIIAIQSAETDLTLVGIPDIKTEKQADFVVNTNHLFETIGSTLLVKASNSFNELDLDLSETILVNEKEVRLKKIPVSDFEKINTLVGELDISLQEATAKLTQPALSSIASFYSQFIESIVVAFEKVVVVLESEKSQKASIEIIHNFTNTVIELSETFKKDKLFSLVEVFDKGVNQLLNYRNEFLIGVPKNVVLPNKKKIKWKKILNHYFLDELLPNTQRSLFDFGVRNFMLLLNLGKGLTKESQVFIDSITMDRQDVLDTYTDNISKILNELKSEAVALGQQTSISLRNYERNICVELINNIDALGYTKSREKTKTNGRRNETISLRNNLSGYANYWYRNQLLAHQQAESGLQIANTGLLLTAFNRKVKEHIDKSLIYPQQHKLKVLINAEKTIHKILSQKEIKQNTNNEVELIAESYTNSNIKSLLETEEESILAFSNTAKKMVELMSPVSFNQFSTSQTESVTMLQVEFSTIQARIIQDLYLAPLQDILQKFEVSYNENSENIYNVANRIKQLIDGLDEDIDKETISVDVHNAVQSNAMDLNKLYNTFTLDVKSSLSQTIDTLNVRTIIDSEKLLSKASKKSIKQQRINDWFSRKRTFINEKYSKIQSFIVQRKQDIDTLKFEEQHCGYVNLIEQTSDFVENLTLDPDVKKTLPFYYKKLFSGSHTTHINSYRKIELDAVRHAFKRIDSGVCGAIMIVGEAQSGKSFFTEALVKMVEKAKRYTINPPEKQVFTVVDLDKAFQKVFSKKADSFNILKKLNRRSVIVFEDIEKWWIKKERGSEVIDYLAKLIDNFGNKHYFVLNTNIHSYYILQKRTPLEKQLLATVIMSPLNKVALKNIIINRHKIGGAEIWLEDELLTHSRKMDKIIEDIHSCSNGNIGVALNKWLSCIQLNENQQLVLKQPNKVYFPKISDANWKLVLYHLIVHKNLQQEHFNTIFKQNINQVKSTLREMEKTGIVYQPSKGVFEIHENLQYYVEIQLKELNILN